MKFTSSSTSRFGILSPANHHDVKQLRHAPSRACNDSRMLKAVFYARFHPERGPSVIHQYPNGSIISTTPPNVDDGQQRQPLLSFSEISSYIIPPYDLCNRPLAICANGYRVLGFPVSLEAEKYERNRFTFNVCFVLSEHRKGGEDGDEDEGVWSWQRVVRKTAAFHTAMEEEDGLLSAEEKSEGLKWAGEAGYPNESVGVVHSLLRLLMEDLRMYGDTCIRVDEVHVLNLRLERVKSATPPKVQAWDVPLLVRELPSPEQWTWDLTLQRIHPHIDGVKHIQRIADLADVELKLVKRAVRELVCRERAILLDVFHFQAVYAPTAELAFFVKSAEVVEECCNYIAVDPAKNPVARGARDTKTIESTNSHPQKVIELYTSLTRGLSIHDFVLAHQAQLANIDVRRFVTFGVIKGFLRRVPKYVLATPRFPTTSNHSGSSPSKSKPKSNEDAVRELDRAWRKAALTSGWTTPPAQPPAEVSLTGSAKSVDEEDERLRAMLDGTHCLDEMCVAMKLSETNLLKRVRSGRFGEVVVFCR